LHGTVGAIARRAVEPDRRRAIGRSRRPAADHDPVTSVAAVRTEWYRSSMESHGDRD